MREIEPKAPERRRFLRLSLLAAVLAPGAFGALASAGCGGEDPPAGGSAAAPEPPDATPPSATPAPSPPAGGGPSGPAGGDDRLITEIPAVAPQVQALQYTDASTTPGQNCRGCQLYTEGDGGRGRCQLFPQGLVSAQGWCSSWVQKVS